MTGHCTPGPPDRRGPAGHSRLRGMELRAWGRALAQQLRLAPNFLQWLEPARGSTPGSGSAGDLLVREALPNRKTSWRAEPAA